MAGDLAPPYALRADPVRPSFLAHDETVWK